MLDFKTYSEGYKSALGVLTGIVGISGPLFTFFAPIAPPDDKIAWITPLFVIISFLLAYLFGKSFRLSSRWCYACGLVAVIMALVGFGNYFISVYPEYVMELKFPDTKIRLVVAKEKYYSGAAKKWIEKNKDRSLSREDLAYDFNLSNINQVFTRTGLKKAEQALRLWYFGSLFLLNLSLCFLVLGDTIRKLATPGKAT
jgi:hypothetical protein